MSIVTPTPLEKHGGRFVPAMRVQGLKEPQPDFYKSLDLALSLEDHWDDVDSGVKQGLLTVGRALGEPP